MTTRPREFFQVLRPDLPIVLWTVLVTAVLSAGVALLLPTWYSAETTLLPPDENSDSFSMLAGMMERSALRQVGLISSRSASDVYEEILDSRRVRETMVKQFGLQSRYKEKNLDKCLKEFDRHVKIDVHKSEILSLKIEDKDPRFAATMANSMIAAMESVYVNTHRVRAVQVREYLEEQMKSSETRMHAAEGLLSAYERTHGIVTGSEQSSVQGAAELLSRKLALQVRRTWMESYAGRDNPSLAAVNSELNAIDAEVGRLPGLKEQASRLQLDLEIQRRVYTLLTGQFEEARLEEERSISGVNVLDPARAPTIKSRPRRSLIVLISVAVGLLASAAWVLQRARPRLGPQALEPA
jgi:tyrosine-protein kinase Etk/Wzc